MILREAPMLSMSVSIGSFEAKTKFAELLRNVEKGFSYSITRNGKTVAVLQSAAANKQSAGIAALSRLSTRASLIQASGVIHSQSLSIADIQELKNDGRKY